MILILITKGPIEGDQRNFMKIENRADWWGPIPPVLYGAWPTIYLNWDQSLSLFQIIIFYVGFNLFWAGRFDLLDKNIRLLRCLLLMVGSIFCSQLWRDSTLLAFVIFGFGLIRYSDTKRQMKVPIIILGTLSVILGALCKMIFSPVIVLLYVITLKKVMRSMKLWVSVSLFCSIFILIVVSHQSLIQTLGLRSTFPEQQPMILDLTSIYCWGASIESNEDAKLELRLVKKKEIPYEAICSSLEPAGWDTLREHRPLWQYSAPLAATKSETVFRTLASGWIQVVSKHPTEYAQIKSIHALQVITMANFLGPRTETVSNTNSLIRCLIPIMDIYMFLPRIFDRFRLFSMASLFCIVIFFLWRQHATDHGSRFKYQIPKSEIRNVLVVSMLQLMITTISFVSNNGRYSFPFVFLSMIFLAENINLKKNENSYSSEPIE